MTRNSRRLQKAVQAIFNDYREKASCPGQVYQNAACGCDNALQMWRGPKGEKGDTGPQGPKGDNAGSFLVDAEFVVDPEGQEPGAYLKLVLIDVAQQEQVVYVDLSYLTDIYTGGNGIDITSMVVAAKLGAGLTFDANGNIASAYQFCDGLDETSNVVKVRLDSSNRILGFASGTCGGLTATVGLAPSATGVNLVLTGAGGAVLSTVPLNGSDGITVQKNAQTGGFTWLADPAGLVSSQTGNQLSVSQTDNKLYVGGNTLEYTFGTGAFTLKDSSGATLSSVTVPSAVRMLENMELRTDDGIYLHLTYLRDNGLHAYQDVSLDELLCNNVDTADDTAAAYSKAVPSGNWQTASVNEIGGRTVVWNQLRNKTANNTTTPYGVTLAYNGTTQKISVTGTATQKGQVRLFAGYGVLPAGHKIISRTTFTQGYTFRIQGGSASAVNGNILFTASGIEITDLVINLVAGTTYNAIDETIVFHDLTLMFGAGNEPSSVAEFEAMFPSIDPAYNAGELRSAGVTEVESKGKNLADFSNGQGTPSSTEGLDTNPRIFEMGKYYLGVSFSNHYHPEIIASFTANDDGSYVLTSGQLGFYGFGVPFQCSPGQTYGASVTVSGSYRLGMTWYAQDGSLISYNVADNTPSFTATAPANAAVCLFSIAPQTQSSSITFSQITINAGGAATAYTTPFTTTLPIPSAVQSLPGYGWSAGTVYNYVDYARKVYVQRVGKIVLDGTQTIQNRNFNAGDNGVGWLYPYSLTNNAIVTRNIVGNLVSDKFPAASYASLLAKTGPCVCLFESNSYGIGVWQSDTSLTQLNTINAYLAANPITVYYELATPIETDVSSLLTDTAIEVEPGGSLTFKNQHNDFRLPVPNSETFIYEHPWVFEDCVKGAMQPAIDALNARIDDVSVELTLDAECREVTVEPATAEPFDDYLLSGSINTLLLEPDGTISDLKHVNTIPNSNTARGSVTMELFNPSDTDGLSIELYAKQSSSSDSRNYYSNVDPEADAQKCATLADFLAAGEQGLPLTYADETSFSGVTPFAENETLYASVVSNGNNSYTFTFTVRAPEVKETRLILDLVSGENRTDLKPLLEHVGGKIDMVAVPSGDAVQLSFGYAGAGYIFGSRRSDFPTVGLFANSAEDICAQTNLIQPTSVGPGADTFTYYFETLPTHFAIPSISEVDATGTKVGTTSYASPMLDMETMRCTGEGTALADIPEAGLVYTEYDTSSRPFVPTGRTLRLRATVGNAGIVFTLWQQETVDKPVLCLEPSCDSCIDLSPVMDTVDEMIDKKIAEIPQYEGATASAAGTDGLVPAATSAEKDMFLKGDGTWEALPTNHVTTDTNQTITGVKTFGAGVYGNVVAMSAGAIDVSAGTVFTKTITANTTISFSNVPAAPATACVTLILTNGGAYTVTWPSSVKWSDGTAPDLTASGVDVLTFLTIDGGTTWYGTVNSIGAA